MEYEEMTFDMFANNEVEQEKGSAQDSFGCCSKYRQCSTEGKCVQVDDYSKKGGFVHGNEDSYFI